MVVIFFDSFRVIRPFVSFVIQKNHSLNHSHMQIYLNEKHVVSRAKWGRRTSLIGLTVLGVGMVASFSPNWIARWANEGQEIASSPLVQWVGAGGWLVISMTCLIAGYLLGQIGNTNLRRYQRSPRPDQVVAKALKGFDDRNRLYGWVAGSDLVFAGPTGVYALTPCDATGKVAIVDDRVRRPFSWRRFFVFGQDGSNTPGLEAQQAAKKASAWLSAQLGAGEPVPVNPLVVFTNDNAQIEVLSASTPVVHHKQLKEFLRSQVRGANLSKETLKAVVDRLDEEAAKRGIAAEN